MEELTQYTRCPHCETAFKVTAKMLSMAHGKVRCGACLAVFQATDYLLQPSVKQDSEALQASEKLPHNTTQPENRESIETQVDQESPQTTNLASEESKPVSENITDEEQLIGNMDQALLEKNNDPEIGEFDEPESNQFNADFELDSALREASGNSVSEFNIDEFDVPEDEDMGLTTEILPEEVALFDEDKPDLQEVNTHGQISEEIPDFQESDLAEFGVDDSTLIEPEMSDMEVDELDIDIASEASAVTENRAVESETQPEDVEQKISLENSNDSLSVSEAISLKQNESANQTIEPMAVGDYLQQHDEIDNDKAQREEEVVSDKSEELLEEKEKLTELPDDSELELLAENLDSQLQEADIEPDPLDEFEEIVKPNRRGLRNIIIIAVILILVIIGGLKFWQNRQQLAWDPTWGAMTQSICQVLPCDIQPRRDIGKIRLRQHLVTPAEDKENVLLVKLVLMNQADFEQPFPRITIKFSNSRGELVATKHFGVAEYFPEKQQQMMSQGTEVHISFETELLHPDALGFEFIFD